MKQTILLDTATTPDGRPMTLLSHDRDRMIRVDGIELMSTRQHHSEERLGELACRHLIGHRGSRVLVGGLGMGFTLRAVLGTLPSDAEVVVAEIMPAVIKWNRDPALGLGADCLVDPRVGLVEGDVGEILRTSPGAFDSVILDVDNGASALSVRGNDRLYRANGVGMTRKALRRGGCVAYWSASDESDFADLLRDSGFTVDIERVRPHAGLRGGGWHTLLLARVT